MRIFTSILSLITVSSMVFADKIENAVDLNQALNLKNVTLYKSGMSYYEYQGILDKDISLKMSFSKAQISDILKSITIIDPKAKDISFRFDSGLDRFANSSNFGVDPKVALTLSDFLAEKKGFMLEVKADSIIRGRILAVENSGFNSVKNPSDTISLFNNGKITTIKFDDIVSFKFLNEDINKELESILALMESEGVSSQRNLYLNIKSNEKRDVKLAYVMKAPIYKISYRAFLEDDSAIFQAWAFINNPNSFDWQDVEISLMSSKPFSFTQDFYTPTYNLEEEIRLIEKKDSIPRRFQMAESRMLSTSSQNKNLSTNPNLFKSNTKESNSDQFSFLIPNKVTILKYQSLAVPLISTNLPMDKFSLLSNINPYGEKSNAILTVELENNSSLKLPSGLVAMYDDGSYIGDAKMKYLAINDKASLKFGEDEDVVASRNDKQTENIVSISINNGLAKQVVRRVLNSTYIVKNKDNKNKQIVLEHPKKADEKVESSIKPLEEKTNYNRYKFTLAPKEERKINISTFRTISSSYELVKLDENRLKYYISNGEIPDKIKMVFEEILGKGELLRQRRKGLKDIKEKQDFIIKSQERARENLKAIGNDNENSKKFLDQILKYEKDINEANKEIQKTKYDIEILEKELKEFIDKIKI
ncbi:DUF4139 domain-containing protein [Campylobacter blaseri]|uniref:Uncharacterized protein n=1 Tax=Campylobacter blaseri TaxID=2042961 RepID=A0A2P8QZU6_9BACT|nr:DUF4139 domain-containing protein [Campylobacter blaseri]PSM51758.1 hypothetical protein CQ405_06410 [Campylobacter blaseri]PSM53549.1 hypothetical protein CRN67_06415 [Campylobacter blaseri]QKF86356.1 DUF4139 domain-containing protein [Campylobacter blaseri]